MMNTKITASSYSLRVIDNPSKNPDPTPSDQKPAHWVDTAGSSFVNPWKSWREPVFKERLRVSAHSDEDGGRHANYQSGAMAGLPSSDEFPQTAQGHRYLDANTDSNVGFACW